MSDTLTDAVARLHRAGSEHSKQTLKLRQVAEDLINWMLQNIPPGFRLPCDCKLLSSGEFIKGNGSNCVIFKVDLSCSASLSDLQMFSQLIASGFLVQLSEKLEREATTFGTTARAIESFIARRTKDEPSDKINS